MPYASVSEVQALAPAVPIDQSSKPSAGAVAIWIDEVSTVLDSILNSLGFQTPITGANSLKIVKRIVTHAVMAMVLRARPNPEADPETFQRVYDKMISALGTSSDPLDLTDATKVDAPVKGESGFRFSSNLRDLALDADSRITITRDKQF